MTAFPEYTKRDVERACERGRPVVENWVATAAKVVDGLSEKTRGNFGMGLLLAGDRKWKNECELEAITQLADRLSVGEVCILTPAEFDAIKQWLPVARVTP